MRNRPSARYAFTLIELLVVIAIIATLAAILFPVFAQAKAKGKQAAGLAHLRQVTLAGLMYVDDNEGRFPQLYYLGKKGQTVPDNFGLFRWPWLLRPYAPSFAVFWDPADSKDPYYRNLDNPDFGYNFGLMPSWGYNAHYLSPGEDPYLPDEEPFTPVGSGAVNKPSETVFLANSTWMSPPKPLKPDVGFYRVYPPKQWAGSSPLNGLSYGHVWPRHMGQWSNTAFVDGHARAMNVQQLNHEELWSGGS